LKSKLVINYIDHKTAWKQDHPKGPSWEEGFGPQGEWHKEWDKAIASGKEWLENEIRSHEDFIISAMEFVRKATTEGTFQTYVEFLIQHPFEEVKKNLALKEQRYKVTVSIFKADHTVTIRLQNLELTPYDLGEIDVKR